jgi:nucleotide-binding universal stress UspA family protein
VGRLWQIEARLRAYLEALAAPLRSQGLEVRTRVVVSEQPAAAVAEAVRADDVNLVVMATHGRPGAARLFLGSVADEVMRKVPVSLLRCQPVERSAKLEQR